MKKLIFLIAALAVTVGAMGQEDSKERAFIAEGCVVDTAVLKPRQKKDGTFETWDDVKTLWSKAFFYGYNGTSDNSLFFNFVNGDVSDRKEYYLFDTTIGAVVTIKRLPKNQVKAEFDRVKEEIEKNEHKKFCPFLFLYDNMERSLEDDSKESFSIGIKGYRLEDIRVFLL